MGSASAQNFEPVQYAGNQKMMLTIDLVTRLKARLTEELIRLDRSLTLRYGDRYNEMKQQLGGTRTRYRKARSDAESSGIIPLDQKQEVASRRFAQAGSSAARKETVLKQKLKDLWYSVTHG
jgi:hypothetical protein